MKELSEQGIQFVSGAGAADDEQKIAGMIGGIVNGITGLFGFKDIFVQSVG
ncbi:hypothetical protein ACRE5D_004433 [Salmonella enterica subsp. enterica serovar Infantis]|uniref:hypothetical protein n=1 Tax=Salmonella TaxID=590 RepID=UPI0003D3C070|nr:hypothetical protein [Salmonella enterica]WNA03231.1 hypothetical protein IT836_25185 [Salmonella enterica subsp. enterica serovar Alachua]WNA08035.1 hypothetical protein LEY62_23635 [Salmonella enterica subsp. enterica serovar Senftenberg]EEO8188978.1 hypothetical protein [Salmonella enterica subsp. enterica serovar Infantis]EGC5478488.1 hypothetical protein [Salmonella enterica]EGF0900684.1 hypothetical protein [Salmonella enterica]